MGIIVSKTCNKVHLATSREICLNTAYLVQDSHCRPSVGAVHSIRIQGVFSNVKVERGHSIGGKSC